VLLLQLSGKSKLLPCYIQNKYVQTEA